MNVLQVLPELSAGGVERTIIGLAEALQNSGHSAYIASAGGRMEAELARTGAILHHLDMKTKNPFKWTGNKRSLIKLIRAHNIDIVHAHSRAPAFAAAWAARATQTPFVTTYHGIYNAKSKLKRAYNSVMTRGDIIIANSNYTAKHIINEHEIGSDKIKIVPRGVDMNRFDPALINKKDVTQLRQKWGVDHAPCLLLPGRLTSWKGQKIAIRALSKIADPQAVLILLGDSQGRTEYVNELKELAKDLNLENRVLMPGHFENMPLAFKAADLVISASTDPEAFGLIAAEAQAMGRWVIASDHGGATETIDHGVTGYRVKVGCPDSLAQAIDMSLTLRPDRLKLRQFIKDNFSEAKMQQSVLDIYRSLLTI